MAVGVSLYFTIVPDGVSGVMAPGVVVVFVVTAGVDIGVDSGKSLRLSVREDLVFIGVTPKITFESIAQYYTVARKISQKRTRRLLNTTCEQFSKNLEISFGSRDVAEELLILPC